MSSLVSEKVPAKVSAKVINQVMHIELHRLDKKNALTVEMYIAIEQAFKEAKASDDVKVILFKGGKNCFCAGNDIADFLDDSAFLSDAPIVTFLHELASIDKPIIAAVSGPAVGIGTTLLLHCDLVYATQKTLFSLPFVNLGVSPEAGSSYLLPKQVGRVRSAELLLLGEPFDAQKAKEFGLINEIVDEEHYWDYAQAVAEKLANKPAQALKAAKKLSLQEQEKVHQVIDVEIAEFVKLLKTDDAKAIFKKFLER